MITPTQAQENSVDAILDYLISNQNIYCLIGYAGTGKTTGVIGTLLQRYEHTKQVYEGFGVNLPENITVTAMSHMAATILAETFPDIKISTFHSTFNIQIRYDDKGFAQSFINYKAGLKLQAGDIVIIDEASMLDATGLKRIHQLVEKLGIKVIFVYDPDQLTVGYNYSKDWNKQYLNTKLTELLRNTNEVSVLAHEYRKAIHTKQFPSNINLTDNIQYIPDRTDFINQFVDEYKQDTNRCILGYKRVTVDNYNQTVNVALGFTEGFSTGQKVVILDSVFLPNQQSALLNNSTWFIDDISQQETKTFDSVSIDYHILTLAKGNLKVRVPWITNTYQRKKYLTQARNNNDGEAINFLIESVQIAHAYASTVHKKQGSTVDTVYIDLTDLGSVNNPDTFARLMYVGISRAKTKVVFTGTLPVKYMQ